MQPAVPNSGQLKVISTGFLSLFSMVGIMFYGLPFFFDFWVRDFNWSHATVTSGNVAGKVIVGPLFGFVAGWLIDRLGPRRMMLSGILMGGIAVMSLSIMHSIWQFYSLYLLMALGYMCGGPLPNQVLTARWFNVSRGRAMGITYLGIGIGGMLAPHIAKWLNMQMEWRSSLFVLGLSMIVIALPIAWFVQDKPQDVPTSMTTEMPKVAFMTIARSWPFYLLAIGSMCSIGAVAGLVQNLKLYFSIDLEFSQQRAANVMSMVLGASIIGRVLMGWLADKYPKKYVMMLIYSLVTVAVLLLHYASVPGVIYLFAILFGIALGGDYMIIPLMAAELFGVRTMGRVMGLVLTVDGFGEAFGPLLAGALRDRTGSYASGFSALIVLSVIGLVSIAMLPEKKNKSLNKKVIHT